MPCNDITDFLKLNLDHHDHLISYRLTKRTCGAEVGSASLIEELVKNKSTSDVIGMSPAMLLEAMPAQDDTEEFLLLKHLFSVQNGLNTLLGNTPTGPDDACVIDRVEYGPDGLEVAASLKLDIITKQIKSCGGCKSGCGTRQ